MRPWLLRAVWITLPLSAGPALAAGLASWADAPAVVGAVLCWAAWGLGLLACVAPRPVGLTTLRAVAPAGVVAAVAAALSGYPSTVASVGAIVATVAAAVLAADPAVAEWTANGTAYRDEHRYPLRVPPGCSSARCRSPGSSWSVAWPRVRCSSRPARRSGGSSRWSSGFAAAALAAIALHRLSRRWLVVVPAGVVVVDRMALTDNVLFTRDHVEILRGVAVDEPSGDALDLRMGATLGSVLMAFDEPAELTARRARRNAGARPCEHRRCWSRSRTARRCSRPRPDDGCASRPVIPGRRIASPAGDRGGSGRQPAADQHVAVVERDHLPGGDAGDRCVE